MRNAKFMQGEFTDKDTVARISSKVKAKEECTELVLNYKKNGEPFWNLLHLIPMVTNATTPIRFFLGGIIDVRIK
jgi:hypothetical protein